MIFVRHYVMRAKPGGGDALATALAALQQAVAALEGSRGVALLRDQADADRFVFIERWSGPEAWKAAGAALPADVMAQVKDWLGAPPEGSSLNEQAD